MGRTGTLLFCEVNMHKSAWFVIGLALGMIIEMIVTLVYSTEICK